MEIREIREGLFRLPIPVPFPMKFVYCYLFRDRRGWSIVDAGMQHEEAVRAWKSVFDRLRIDPKAVHSLYVTHFHPDHLGLAGLLQDWTGAPVYMSPQEMTMAKQVWSPGSTQAEEVRRMCLSHGMPDELAEQVKAQMKVLSGGVRLPVITPLAQQTVRLADMDWDILITPGHSDGHVCLYQSEHKLLFAGDHVLHKITPNISRWPNASPNPLKLYIESLNRLKSLDIQLALTSHADVIPDTRQRIDEILAHHEGRLERVLQLASGGRTAYETALVLFGHRELNAHQWRFALAETLAHLVYLEDAGRLSSEIREGRHYYYGNAGQLS
ncbi:MULTISPECIES: MBL fold metallo-hydrolase [Paenibacillus]|uniref:MBL fold metallo-hydrolase n=1 Tax=Paenibacillus TaxID=44249 RepID=UPI0006D097C8